VIGLQAGGACEADIEWHAGEAVRMELLAMVDGQQKLRAPKGQTIASVVATEKPVALSAQADGTVAYAVKAGQSYVAGI
jgi:hypothetical protein